MPEPPADAVTDGDVPPGEAVLPDLWYYALPSLALKRGAMLGKTLLGQPILFARSRDGEAFALLDICPHRAVPLRHGRFDGAEVECCYHGWRFDRAGVCTRIPALVEGQPLDPRKIKVRRFLLREAQGVIWIFAGRDPARAPPPPLLPGIGEAQPQLWARVAFPCAVDHAVVGLMDSAHGPFVHRAWWWCTAGSIHAKAKRYGASELGFRMLRHAPSRNSRGYRLLGGGISTEITFRLPGVRIEHIEAGRHAVVGLTAVTPIDGRQTELHHAIYWTLPWLTAARPLLRPFALRFLEQDRAIVALQQEGLRYNPPLLLIDDADLPAKWYYRLKKEWLASRAEGRSFVNPVPAEAVLRWRS